MRRLRRLTRLSAAELGELAEAQLALLHAQLLRWLRPTGAFLAPVAAQGAPGTSSTIADARDVGEEAVEVAELAARAERLALAVARAAENGIFRPACLVRALALTRMLRTRGIEGSQLRVGVRWEADHFAAHAWVEYRGRILGDRPENVGRYTVLSDVEMLPGGRGA